VVRSPTRPSECDHIRDHLGRPVLQRKLGEGSRSTVGGMIVRHPGAEWWVHELPSEESTTGPTSCSLARGQTHGHRTTAGRCERPAPGSLVMLCQVEAHPCAGWSRVFSLTCASAPQLRSLSRIDCNHVQPTRGSWTLARAASGRRVARHPFERLLRPDSSVLSGAWSGRRCGTSVAAPLPARERQCDLLRSGRARGAVRIVNLRARPDLTGPN
jgi:hypothetical protein